MGLHELFHQHYATRKARLRARLLAGDDPLIVRVGPELMFLHQRQRFCTEVTGEAYDQLKQRCHLPLALYMRLAELVDAPLSSADLRELETVAEWIDALEDDHPAGQAIVACTAEVLSGVLEMRQVSHALLLQLAEGTQEPIEACIEESAHLELSAIHEAVETWTADFDDAAWSRLHVVVCANHQARYKQATKLYFQRRLGERQGEGADGEHRVLYAENAGSLDEALTLLATHLLDAELGIAFKDSPLALQQDVLGDAAQRALDDLLG